MKRINSIDIVRGLVMIIMALDHVRDLMHVSSITESPTNLATTTPILFFTRWITHLCAPTFVFLAGTSAYLSFKKNQHTRLSRNFLLKRGLYLVLLEFIVVNFALFFDFAYHTLLFEVIAAIGFGFIILGLSLKAGPKTLGLIGFAIIVFHQLVALLPLADNSAAKTIVSLFFNPGALPFSDRVFIMGYPPIPWLGIMLLGFGAGKLFEGPAEERTLLFARIGLAALGVFALVRYINQYGDPVKWIPQAGGVYTFLSFMNVSKYPPSLLFCLVTLGIMFIMLALTEGANQRLWKVASVYGRVPLFYFLAHFFLIHILMVILMLGQGFAWTEMNFASGSFGRPKGVQSGVELPQIYLIWVAVVVALYQPCRWFAKYKSEHKYLWLKYV